MTSPFLFFVGIDWGSTTHHVCLLEANGSVRGSRAFPHGGAGQAELVRWLLDETGAAPGQLAVAIETPHGPVVEGLLVAGFAVFAIGPAQIPGSRRRYVSSGAKDDPRDAWMLARALRADPDLFRRVELEKPLVLQLRERTRTINELTCQRTRLCHQIRQQLWRYYPQLLAIPDLLNQLTHPWFRELWNKAKTPALALKLRVSTLAKLLKKHGIRRLNAKGLWEILHAPALTVAPGAACRALQSLFAQAHTTNQLLAQARQDVRELLKAFSQAHPDDERPDDMTLFRSLPGVGGYVLSTLFAEAFDLLQRRDYPALRATRLGVDHELRNALYHWARVAAVHDPLSKARYRALRARGHSHGRALRTVGDRLLAVACAMLKNGTLYDPKLSRDKLAA
ncbi:Putative transposase y4uE [Geodia barretti]|uniref:Transposase y4uE n=1 Tax=Geodia barretti TaxID=519541 RepID=A0AA35W9A3_GEOBA|nr:Putative transposase y4uE [Geodia barretti]